MLVKANPVALELCHADTKTKETIDRQTDANFPFVQWFVGRYKYMDFLERFAKFPIYFWTLCKFRMDRK
jgi:hypothetical protein